MHQNGQRQRRFRVKQFFFLFQRADILNFFVTDITRAKRKTIAVVLKKHWNQQKKIGLATDQGKDTKGNDHSPYLKCEECVALDFKNDETDSRSIT